MSNHQLSTRLKVFSAPWSSNYSWSRSAILHISDSDYLLVKAEAGGLQQATPSPVYLLDLSNDSFADPRTAILGSPQLSEVTREILVADFNNDGTDDFFLSNQGREDPAGFPGERNQLFIFDEALGTYTEQLLPDMDFSHGSSVGDFNGDGKMDIFVNNLGSLQNVPSYLLMNDGNGKLEINRLSKAAERVAGPLTTAIDLDGDGIYELVSTHGDYKLAFWSNLASETPNLIKEMDIALKESGVFQLLTGDVDGNGRADIVITGDTAQTSAPGNPAVTTGGNIRTYVYLNPGSTQELLTEVFTAKNIEHAITGGQKVAIRDIDNDGKGEIEIQSWRADWTSVRYTISNEAGNDFDIAINSHGVSTSNGAWLDADGDGIQDFAFSTGNQLVVIHGEILPEGSEANSGNLYVTNNQSTTGTQGNDYFFASAGYNRLDGGEGIDTLLVSEHFGDEIHVRWQEGVWALLHQTTILPPLNVELTNFEYLEFKGRNIEIAQKAHESYEHIPDDLWFFFLVAFNGAPGVTYMDWMLDRTGKGKSIKEFVDVFVTAPQFKEVYPDSMSLQQFATKLVSNTLRDTALPVYQQAAVDKILALLESGSSRGDVIYHAIGDMKWVSKTSPIWGETAKLFENQKQVAKFYTDIMSQSTTDETTLRSVISNIKHDSDLSSSEKIVELIGLSLLGAAESLL